MALTDTTVSSTHVYTCDFTGLYWCVGGSPVVAHRLENGIVKLNGPRDEQGGVLWLRRHVDGVSGA